MWSCRRSRSSWPRSAEDDVVAAVALDVVVAVGARAGPVLDRARGSYVSRLHVDGDAPRVVDDRTVALDPVVAELAEEHVVAGAAGDVESENVAASGVKLWSYSVIERTARRAGRLEAVCRARSSSSRRSRRPTRRAADVPVKFVPVVWAAPVTVEKIVVPARRRKRGLGIVPVRRMVALSPAIDVVAGAAVEVVAVGAGAGADAARCAGRRRRRCRRRRRRSRRRRH